MERWFRDPTDRPIRCGSFTSVAQLEAAIRELIDHGNDQPHPCDGKLRDELPNGEIFERLIEAKDLIEGWRHEYDTAWPHSSWCYHSPAPEAATAT